MGNLNFLALQLLRACEQLYAERTLLEGMMRGVRVPGWKPIYDHLLNDQDMRAKIHQQFQPLYDLVEHDGAADKAILKLIRDLPKPDKLN